MPIRFVTTLFTDQYVAAVPIFRIFLLIMLRQCFEMSTPLRAMNENRYFMIGNLVAILVNAGFIFATFDDLGPAVHIYTENEDGTGAIEVRHELHDSRDPSVKTTVAELESKRAEVMAVEEELMLLYGLLRKPQNHRA